MHPRSTLLIACLILRITTVSSLLGSWNSFAHATTRYQLASIDLSTDSSTYEEETEQRNLRFAGVGRLYAPTLSSDDDSAETAHLEVVDRLEKSTVAVVGLGGVGSWAAEALCRSGIGNLVLIDLDDICISNTNRQIHAMSSTVGKFKIDEVARRFGDINPACNITLIHDFVSADNVDSIFGSIPDLTACLDAIDGARGKSALMAACARHQIPVSDIQSLTYVMSSKLVTCGGSAGRTDPCAFVCEDLARVSGDPLLTSCRRNLRKAYGFEAGEPFKNKEGKRNRPARKWNIMAIVSKEPQKASPKGSDASSLRRCDGALGTGVFVTGTAGFGTLNGCHFDTGTRLTDSGTCSLNTAVYPSQSLRDK
eukprot:scaffold5159_cov112-Cylindrotheca_fusiformis.AAC.21